MSEPDWQCLTDARRLDDEPTLLPDGPGLYGWRRSGRLMFVGAARRLQWRIVMFELNPPQQGGRQVSPLRERVALWLRHEEGHTFRWRGDPSRREAVDRWLRRCEVAWTPMPIGDARRQAETLLDARPLPLHQWRPRPGEDEWLLTSLTERRDAGGRVYVEVSIGGGPGSATWFIDAVRIPGTAELDIRYYGDQPRGFERDVAGTSVEVIEVKQSLNRGVVGQLIVARDLIRRLWREVRVRRCLAVVVRDDALIRELGAENYDIEVFVVPRHDAG